MTQEQAIGFILLALTTILPLFFGSQWWKKKAANNRVLSAIEAAATAAVNSQNRTLVGPARANPDLGGVGVLPVAVGHQAKINAVNDVLQAVASQINPQAGIIVEKLLPIIDVAIEKAVEAAKPKVPQATSSLFPDKFNPAIYVLIAGAALTGLGACQSAPDGYRQSLAADVETVAQVAFTELYGDGQLLTDNLALLRDAGRDGAAQYISDTQAGIDKQTRILTAVNVILKRLPDAALEMRGAFALKANDADQVLGLLLAAIRAEIAAT